VAGLGPTQNISVVQEDYRVGLIFVSMMYSQLDLQTLGTNAPSGNDEPESAWTTTAFLPVQLPFTNSRFSITNWKTPMLRFWSRSGVLVFAALFVICFEGKGDDASEAFPEYSNVRGLCYGDPGFVAAGEPGLIYFSPDGESWLKVHEQPKAIFNSVVYHRGRYYTVGMQNVTRDFFGLFASYAGRSAFLSSPDGVQWQQHPFPSTNSWLGAIIASDSGLLVLSGEGVWFSGDGLDWKKHTFTTQSIYSALWAAGQFMIATLAPVGDNIYARPVTIWTSPDGEKWTSHTPEIYSSGSGLFHDGNDFYFTGDRLFTSKTGSFWAAIPQVPNILPLPRSYAGGLYLKSESGTQFASWNKEHWTPLEGNGQDSLLRSLTKGQNGWAAISNDGISSSRDGVHWEKRLRLPDGAITLTNDAPMLRIDLADARNIVGRSLVLQADVSAKTPLTYAWFKDNRPLDSETNAYLFFPSLNQADSGTYRVIARNSFGSITSSWARVTLVAPRGPEADFRADDIFAIEGESILFRAPLNGAPPLRCQWYKDGVPLPYAQTAVLAIEPYTPRDEGSYYIEVTNQWGAARSAPFNIKMRQPIFTSSWNRIDPEPPPPDWRSITFGNGRFVAIGGTNNAIASSDTIEWDPSGLASVGWPTAVVFDGRTFLAASSTGEIFRSVDGLSWEKQLQVNFPLTCLATSPSQVVAGGQFGNFAVLAEGKWSTASTGGDEQWNAVAWTGDRFIVAAHPDTLLVSTNGRDWTRQRRGTEITWSALLISSNNISALGFSSSPSLEATQARLLSNTWEAVLSSPSLLFRSSPSRSVSFWPNAAIAWNKQVLAIGGPPGYAADAYALMNGSWRHVTLPSPALRAITANDTFAVAVGEKGTILVSTNLQQWEHRDHFWPPIRDLIFDGRQFVALGDDTVSVSTDGVSWSTRISAVPGSISSFSEKDGIYVVQGNPVFASGIYYSKDLINWSLGTPSKQAPDQFVRSGNLFVGTTYTGKIYTSENGYSNWKLRLSASQDSSFYPLATTDNILWVSGYDGLLLHSFDATNWTEVPIQPKISFSSFCYANGIYLGSGVLVGAQSQTVPSLFTSPDGTNWTAQTLYANRFGDPSVSYPFFPPTTVQSLGDLFIARTSEGDVFFSPDGQHWDLSFHSPVGPYLRVAASASDLLIYPYPNGLFHAKRLTTPRYVTIQAARFPEGLRITVRGENVNRVEIQFRDNLTKSWTTLATLDLSAGSAEWTTQAVDQSNSVALYRALIIE
jgi:hypothetical protein